MGEKDGQKRSKLEVIADEIEIMSARQGQQQPQTVSYQQPQQAMAYPSPAPAQDAMVYDAEIPF